MSKTIPLQDSVGCGGRYCTRNVHRLHGKTCKACGRYLCLTCYDEKGYCKDCDEAEQTMAADFANDCYREEHAKDAGEFTEAEIAEMDESWEAYAELLKKSGEELMKLPDEETPATNPAYEVPDEPFTGQHDHQCICGRESVVGTNLCPDCDVDELRRLGLD